MIDITSNIKGAIEKLRRIPKEIIGSAVQVIREESHRIERIMSRPGLKITYPVRWDSEKQKRYVIAKLKAEDNLPYERTGEHSNGWESGDLMNGAFVQNLGHQAVFLYGTPSGEFAGASLVTSSGQSHIHEGRWRLVKPVIDAVMARIPKSILDKVRIESNG
jgi:hypothetical protein